MKADMSKTNHRYPVSPDLLHYWDNRASDEVIAAYENHRNKIHERTKMLREQGKEMKYSELAAIKQELHKILDKEVQDGNGSKVVYQIMMYNGKTNYMTVEDMWIDTKKYS